MNKVVVLILIGKGLLRRLRINDFTNHIYSIVPARIWRGLYYETGSSTEVDWSKVVWPELP